MQFSKFAVDESPFCMWEWDLHQRNLDFVRRLDPTYFEYLANVHAQALDEPESAQHAALSLRTAYSHGLETFFALLFAAIQAPDCVVGWLHKYQARDLRKLIKKVQTRRPVLSKILVMHPETWTDASMK